MNRTIKDIFGQPITDDIVINAWLKYFDYLHDVISYEDYCDWCLENEVTIMKEKEQ